MLLKDTKMIQETGLASEIELVWLFIYYVDCIDNFRHCKYSRLYSFDYGLNQSINSLILFFFTVKCLQMDDDCGPKTDAIKR